MTKYKTFAFNISFIYLLGVGAYHSLRVAIRRQSMGSVLSLHHVGTGDRIQVIGLGSKCLYPLSSLASPRPMFFKSSPEILSVSPCGLWPSPMTLLGLWGLPD